MPTEADPVVQNWYLHLDKGQRFVVVAVDQDEGTVEIQNFDGNIEEITIDNWYEQDIEPAAEPENWSGALDIDNRDDLGTEITDTPGQDWNEPLTEIQRRRRGLEQPESPDESED